MASLCKRDYAVKFYVCMYIIMEMQYGYGINLWLYSIASVMTCNPCNRYKLCAVLACTNRELPDLVLGPYLENYIWKGDKDEYC